MRFALLVAATLIMGAGCLDDNTPTDTTTPGEPVMMENATMPQVSRGVGNTGVGAGAGGTAANLAGTGGAFTVSENATILLAEIKWADPVQDIDLSLDTPDGPDASGNDFFDYTATGGSPGAPDSPHSLMISAPETGEWRLTGFGNGPAAQVDYSWVVTIFYGETAVPDGYTALE